MALYLHGGEGKEATKKEKKTYVEGLQATNNVIKMEIDGSGPYFRKNKMSWWLKLFPKKRWKE